MLNVQLFTSRQKSFSRNILLLTYVCNGEMQHLEKGHSKSIFKGLYCIFIKSEIIGLFFRCQFISYQNAYKFLWPYVKIGNSFITNNRKFQIWKHD